MGQTAGFAAGSWIVRQTASSLSQTSLLWPADLHSAGHSVDPADEFSEGFKRPKCCSITTLRAKNPH
jgi:hypothetical protein